MESSSVPVLLSDGRLVWVRPLRSEDAHRLIDLCQRLSPETRRRRFLRATIMCTPSEAERLATVDQVQHVALAAVADSAPDAPIVAIGRSTPMPWTAPRWRCSLRMPTSTSDSNDSC